MPSYLTIDQFAARLGISRKRLYCLIRRGDVSGVIKTKEQWLIHEDLGYVPPRYLANE